MDDLRYGQPMRNVRGRLPSGEPNPIDIHVGRRLRLRRSLLGYSQEKVAKLIGVTFQQVQKLERGTNRIGASRLWDIAQVLGVHPGYFFDEMPEAAAAASPRLLNPDAPPPEPFAGDEVAKRETMELVRAYYRLKDARARRSVADLIKSLSREEDVEGAPV